MRTIDLLFEALSAICIVYMVSELIFEYPDLADKVPIHYGANGSPDDWGSKSTLLILPLVSIIFYAGLTVINIYPHTFNFPIKITQENAVRQYELAKSLITILKFTLVGTFLYIQLQTINVAKELQSGLGVYFIVFTMLGTFLPIVIYFILAFKNK